MPHLLVSLPSTWPPAPFGAAFHGSPPDTSKVLLISDVVGGVDMTPFRERGQPARSLPPKHAMHRS